MIIRFRGKHGNYRVNVEPQTPLNDVVAEVTSQLPSHQSLRLSRTPSAPGELATEIWQKPIQELGIKHGDLFFVTYQEKGSAESVSKDVITPTSTPSTYLGNALDRELASKNGRINRPQTDLCTHGPKGMCEYCQPLEPWDEDYQRQQGIKHLSFHAWRRKIGEEGSILEEPNYKVNKKCMQGHAPWPASFCSKCQPPAITLQRQKFRMVDHVEFNSPQIVEQFIEFWRSSNCQRIGFLVGKYESYADHVPLGIKASVYAIWEPRQLNDIDSLLVQELPSEAVLEAAKLLDLEVLGVIFTDLQDAGTSGKVVTKRHLNSYYLSSLEIMFSSRLQNQYPHYLASDNHLHGKSQGPMKSSGPLRFSSQFVTCCVSGNEFGDIDVACYQVSTQAEALVLADLVVPSTNPAVMRIEEPSDSRYVPDISYRRINEYKLTVTEDAKPAFPVDYLLVSLSHGFKTSDESTISSMALKSSFTLENREQIRMQTPSQLAEFLNVTSTSISSIGLHDFHALLYLLTLGVLQSEDLRILKLLLAEGDSRKLEEYELLLAAGPGINTLRMLAS